MEWQARWAFRRSVQLRPFDTDLHHAAGIAARECGRSASERLREALEKKLFEDTKDQIQISRFVSVVQDEEQQQRFDLLKDRMIKQFGYNDDSATEVLRYVASLFAR